METRLSKAGFGTGVDPSRKVEYFKADLAELLEAYGVALCAHPFSEQRQIFVVNAGKSFSDGRALVQ